MAKWRAAAGVRAKAAWEATCRALPIGSEVAGTVIGRRPFGVFIAIDGLPDAIGLAEVTAMPVDADLPEVGQWVTGLVIWHAEHNHQVKIGLAERWAES